MKLRAAAVLLALATLAGCTAHAAAGTAKMPRGIVFVREVASSDAAGSTWPGVTHAYRDGRLVATYPGRVLVARDNPAASLLYDDRRRRARSIRGGPWRPFAPCPDPYNRLIYELSPDGRRGLCLSEFDHSDELVVFDVRDPQRTRRVAFKVSVVNRPYVASWVDDERIAAIEYRPRDCPYQHTYGFAPGGVTVFDLHGRALERGPCMAGVLAGPRGLVYVQLMVDYTQPQSWLPLLFRRQEHLAFSSDGGRSWRFGDPAFADDDGHVYYTTGFVGTLRDEAGRKIRGGVFDAAWARAGVRDGLATR